MEDTKRWLDEDQWALAVIRLECAVLEGRLPDMETLMRLPEIHMTCSPLLKRAYGELLFDSGELVPAREALQQAVKGLARQTFQRELLSAMALLASVDLRLGEWQEAETALRFLFDEAARDHPEMDGRVPLALARGSRLLGRAGDGPCFYMAAYEAFERSGDYRNGCVALLDMMLQSGSELAAEQMEQAVELLRRRQIVMPELAAYADCAKALLFVRTDRLRQAAGLLATVNVVGMPYTLAEAIRVLVELASIRSCEIGMRQTSRTSVSLTEQCPVDVELLYWQSLVRLARAVHDGEDEAVRSELRQAQLYRELAEPLIGDTPWKQTDWLQYPVRRPFSLSASLTLQSKKPGSDAPCPEDEAITPSPDAPGPENGATTPSERGDPPLTPNNSSWTSFCFGGLKFARDGTEVRRIHWGRRKGQELFLYLLLRPGFAAPRDTVLEALFAEGEPGKRANQLYVAIHQAKRVLRSYLGTEETIALQNGVLKLDERLIEWSDTETYRTLVRVGDQLWHSDKDLSAELYGQAALLYGELLPELDRMEWLDELSQQYEEMQARVLQRLAQAAGAKSESEAAEMYIREWLGLRPADEEAYQAMLRLLVERGRIAEAHSLYRRLEDICRSELHTEPLPETKRLLTR